METTQEQGFLFGKEDEKQLERIYELTMPSFNDVRFSRREWKSWVEQVLMRWYMA